MLLTIDEAWLLIDDAAKSLQSCQLLSARKQRNVLHALGTLKESPPHVVDPHQLCSPNTQKCRKFYAFLHRVLHTRGPHGVLVATIALTQTTVSGMTNDHRNAICQKLASHKDWQPPTNPHLQSHLQVERRLRGAASRGPGFLGRTKISAFVVAFEPSRPLASSNSSPQYLYPAKCRTH